MFLSVSLCQNDVPGNVDMYLIVVVIISRHFVIFRSIFVQRNINAKEKLHFARGCSSSYSASDGTKSTLAPWTKRGPGLGGTHLSGQRRGSGTYASFY